MSINRKKYKIITIVISIVLPLVIAFLFGMEKIEGYDFSILPTIYATTNGATAMVLLLAYFAIKKKNKKRHQLFINIAIVLSLTFLVLYVIYHATMESTIFGDINHNHFLDDMERSKLGLTLYLYRFILISHILLSIIITPFVCFTYLRGWLGDYEKHKKLTRITFPLWMYVAISGVLVYLFISPYYI